MNKTNISNYIAIISRKPQAMAFIKGSNDYPTINGTVKLYQTKRGVVVVTEVSGLPKEEGECNEKIFGYHIHGGNNCTGNMSDPFSSALSHYDTHNCNHPYHAGDLPPLFGCKGYAFSAVLTNRFNVRDIIGKTVIIHSNYDDFSTQPGGNSGTKIACGVIKPNTRHY